MITSLPKRNTEPRDLSIATIRANAEATRAAGRTPCDRCGKPATMFVSIESERCHSHRCYWCSCDLSQWAYQHSAPIVVHRLADVVAVRDVEGVVLADYCREVLDGATGDVPAVVLASLTSSPSAASFDGARDVVVVTLEARIRRPMTETELSAVTIAVSTELTRRDRQKRADLRETQTALRVASRVFARRIG